MITLRQRMLNYVSSRFANDPPPLRLIFWDGERFDFAADPASPSHCIPAIW
jgi:hypothetical protein